jgi:hypothetical protein
MYQINHPLTGELVNVYADNIPASEGTILDFSYPVRKQCVTVEKEDKYYGTIIEKKSEKEILDPENYNDVVGVIIENPVVKAEDGKIDKSMFQLILERPLEPVSEAANKIIFTSEEPEILEVDEEGNLNALVELGQTYVTVKWPSGVIAKVLVTIGEVSEVKPAEPVLGGDVVEPEAPEQGGEGGEEPEQPVDPNPEPEPEPEDPETPVEPEVKEAKIMYGLLPYGNITHNVSSIDDITVEDLESVEYTKIEIAPLEKTRLSTENGDILIILIPTSSELVATRDSGAGGKVAFSENPIGCNGQKTYTIEGIEYKLFAEFQTAGSNGYYIYID